MIDLSTNQGSVAVLGEVLRESYEVFEFRNISEPWAQSVDASGSRAFSCHQGGSAWVAQWCLAMGVGKS